MAEVLRLLELPPGAKRQALMDFLGEIKAEPWVLGSLDCAYAAARWIGRVHSFDACRDLPKYASQDEAEAIIKQNGGLDRMVQIAMAKWGFAFATPPEDGDVGLLASLPHAPAIGGGAFAIFAGGLWVSKVEQGLFGCRRPALMSWRI